HRALVILVKCREGRRGKGIQPHEDLPRRDAHAFGESFIAKRDLITVAVAYMVFKEVYLLQVMLPCKTGAELQRTQRCCGRGRRKAAHDLIRNGERIARMGFYAEHRALPTDGANHLRDKELE